MLCTTRFFHAPLAQMTLREQQNFLRLLMILQRRYGAIRLVEVRDE